MEIKIGTHKHSNMFTEIVEINGEQLPHFQFLSDN